MGNKIYLVGEKETLYPMEERPYDSEDLLQGLLERYPDLLAGDQVDPDAPRRWLLVKREMNVPDSESSSGRWSLDHLFLDQDGVPTLVEVKRATDTRVRREVVAQLLDYAANAVLYWPVERIKESFVVTQREAGKDPDQVLARFLTAPDGEVSPEDFWRSVESNLDAEHIRMVFVADTIPRELQRIVEFLGEHMKSVELVAVEVKQFVGGDLRTLVPRAIGRTAKSTRKSPSAVREWDESSFMEVARRDGTPSTPKICAALLEWLAANGCIVYWMKGVLPHFAAALPVDDDEFWFFEVWAEGGLMFLFKSILDDRLKEEFRRRIGTITGVKLSKAQKELALEPDLEPLADPAAWQQFTATLKWLMDEMQAHPEYIRKYD